MDVLDREYLDWLNERTERVKTVYFIPGMTEDNNVALLKSLFDKIDEYVKQNYYFIAYEHQTTDVGEISRYSFNDGNNKYTITKNDHGPEIVYSIQKDNSKTVYINLEDVKKKVIRGKENLEVLYRMKTISIYLRELNNMGVPMDRVEESIDRELKLIRDNKKRTC